MKKIALLFSLCFAFMMNAQVALAQKFKVLEGDVKALTAVQEMNVEYDYSNMGVGKFENEQDYLDKKVKEYNEKESGKGNTWMKSWKGDRTKRFHPNFEELFNKHAKRAKVGNFPNAKYTMIAATTYTEPGFNVHVMRKNASINMEFTILDANKNVVAKIQMKDAPGRTFGGYDYDTGSRLEEAYAMAGKALAKKYFNK